MGYCLNKNIILVGGQRRIFFKRQNVARLFYPLAVFACFFALFSIALPALAVETTKASALTLEEMRETYSLSNTITSPHSKGSDSCSSFLKAHLSPDAEGHNPSFSKSQRVSARVTGKNPAAIALSVYLGVRIARGPQELTNVTQDNFQKASYNKKTGGHPRALAIAAYRACKNEENLKRYKDSI